MQWWCGIEIGYCVLLIVVVRELLIVAVVEFQWIQVWGFGVVQVRPRIAQGRFSRRNRELVDISCLTRHYTGRILLITVHSRYPVSLQSATARTGCGPAGDRRRGNCVACRGTGLVPRWP